MPALVFRQEMERQRLAEWEQQRKNELMEHRQREQEKVLVLKAKQEHINNDLEKLVSEPSPGLILRP
jgi:hypothetical protein